MQDKRKELLEGEMRECYKAEPKSLQADAKSMAVKEWKLLDEEHRSGYQERAAGAEPIHPHVCMDCSMGHTRCIIASKASQKSDRSTSACFSFAHKHDSFPLLQPVEVQSCLVAYNALNTLFAISIAAAKVTW